MSSASLPPSNFDQADLVVTTVPAGTRYGRILLRRFSDTLGFGKNESRFSDPRDLPPPERFGVLYVGSTLKVCFVEAILRDSRDGVIGELLLAEQEITDRDYAEIVVVTDLRVVDLRSENPLRMGIPSDVVGGSDQRPARQWSLALHNHPAKPDGILYPSRLNEEINLAIFERAIPKLSEAARMNLNGIFALEDILDLFQVAIRE
ncbi:RES family NAD+ phosphorylase [Komagataeibacter rhaeticus]|uniref:RES family NAD+ phosphorylase n=1 Tax=Komagataeibacter rhaeticus TaxID=215221 RepID=A0A181C679_9PROT|nr:RES family NAD+ phosphorylase [Komagataeibacter rhaeticus]QIP36633.1 RES family NAD+ phosphorylase [Komagataeibacter rhaeticus]QOC46399.1 RES family NAD+ phosphorylase [Komagataeibacter rhaeticus]SAY47062.1 RES domain protein [Komagataeibacter rhaeticus]SAY50064.1 RES domain protein [Komagataeibacter rhaeticus]